MWQSKTQKSESRPEANETAGGREYVNVVADYRTDGTIRPISVRLADGPAYAIARVISVTHLSRTRKNGAETRYYVRIGDREHYLFFEDAQLNKAPRWFI